MNRRELLSAGAAAALAPAAGVAADAGPTRAASRVGPPDLGFLRDTPLVNADRLRWFMRAAGLDALVVAHPANVFYLTNLWPQLDRMGYEGSGVAVFPADPKRPLALVMQAFLYYYTHSPESAFTERLVFPFTQPLDPGAAVPADGSEPAAAPARPMRVQDPALVSARDEHRRRMLELARPASVDATWALAKAVRELGVAGGRLGIDDPRLEASLRSRGVSAEIRDGEDALRRARLAKSAPELRLMRLAAQNNVEAALAAAYRARELGSTRRLRAEFYAEAARRGNVGHFMVIGGASTETLDEPLRDGMAVSIDCVSTCRHYHGDFGRTIFIGEPREPVKRAAAAVANAWLELRAQLRAGMRFADVSRIGREALRKQGVDLNVSFRPHSVGLFHTDHPQPSLIGARAPDDLVLEENMVLSVDCPITESGLGGTTHLEDLLLIRRDGAEPIHEVPPPVVVV